MSVISRREPSYRLNENKECKEKCSRATLNLKLHLPVEWRT